jgi:hypothetical protein
MSRRHAITCGSTAFESSATCALSAENAGTERAKAVAPASMNEVKSAGGCLLNVALPRDYSRLRSVAHDIDVLQQA